MVSPDRKVFDEDGRLVAILPEQVNGDIKYVRHVRHRTVNDTDATVYSSQMHHRPAWKYGVPG